MVRFNVSGGRMVAPLVKCNTYSVLVRLADGNIIKRHIYKHNVEFLVEG